jgi:type IV pilus assembly protein PilB
MAKRRKKIGQYLLRWGVVTEQQIEDALKVATGSGKRLGEVLIELEFASEDDVCKALANQFDLEYIDLDNSDAVSPKNFDLIDKEMVRKFLVLPISKSNGRMKVLVHDPMDLDLLDALRFRLGCEIDAALGSRTKIKAYIEKMFSETKASIDAAIGELSIDRGMSMDGGVSIDQAGIAEPDDEDDQAPVVRLVNKIIHDAVNERASDIHIEPMASEVRVRYRIDGVCQMREAVPKRTQSAVLSRLKIMSGMKLDERRIPQDGRIKIRMNGVPVDFRASACPAYHGESFVLRILRTESVKIGLRNIGFEEDTLDNFNKAILRPNGIFLVTGPTGSGKTTTLYSALDVLNRPDRKIITAEDPVEYNFSGINQCQIREDIGLTFPMVLRSMLRQAPNIILVGEIRDKEVADVAIQAALTGHLVFSTLHTNDAPSAITRLIDMGVKPFLVASSIQAVMAQRLIRVLCPDCKTEDNDPDKFYLRLCGIKDQELANKKIYKAVGCSSCSNSGYRGRKAVFEWMTMNAELRDLAFKKATSSELRSVAEAAGMRTLVGDGKLKILNGVTTPEEISRVAQVDETIEDVI